MTDNTQPEALRLANSIIWMDTFTDFQRDELDKAAAELRRQHARIAELEAQLASIGAGGVSPLIGQPQAMPDLSALTERGAVAWAGVDAQGLREGFTAADMATAAAQGFRDGAASLAASAGEPVAHLWQHCETGRTRIVMPDMIVDADASWQVVGPLYLGAAPPTAQAEGWRPLIEAPFDEIVLVAAEFDGSGDWRIKCGYLDKQTTSWRVFGASWEPTRWMPLPLPPTSAEGVEHAD